MTKYSLFATIFIIIISSLNAFGDEKQQKGTRLNISASESIEVEGDLLDAILRYEITRDTPETLQKDINEKMQLVVQQAAKYKNAKLSTENYFVYDNTPQAKNGQEQKTIWKGSQSIHIQGQKEGIKEILKLTQELQSIGLSLTSLNYFVSAELREKMRDSLIEKAVKQILDKSKRVANVLNNQNIDVLNLDINLNDFYPAPIRSFSMLSKNADAESAPVALPSNERVSVTVNAIILISGSGALKER